MFVDFSLPENVVAKIKKGYLIRVTTVAYPDQVFEGNIIAYSSALVNDTRSLTVRALVGNPLEKLLPGMFANINVVLPASKKVFLIPQIAVNYSPVGDFVYTVKNNLAKRQYITVGERRDDNISVLKGLTVDDNVVYAGQVKLRNNAKVIVEK